jgi:hypothetical protein
VQTSLTSDRLKQVLAYNRETGIFTWRKTLGRCRAGAEAGTIRTNGYRYIGVDGVHYLAHRLAWLYEHGSWPASDLDHRDRRRTNNAISNLREVIGAGNQGNSGIWATNTSGYRGVYHDRRRGTWNAYIRRQNRKHHLGCFGSPEAAAAAYDRAAIEHFGDFASPNLARAT